MSRTAQIRIGEEMEGDVEVIRAVVAGQGAGSSLADVIRLSLRQLRLRIDAGLPLLDPALATTAAAAPPPKDPRAVERKPWTPAEEKLLGKASDADVAARIGREPEAVGVRRRSLKIPAYKPPAKAARPRKK